MPAEIGEPGLHRRPVLLAEIGLDDAAMHLERAHGRHDHGGGRRKPRLAALDVEELLGPEIGAEAGFGDGIIGETEGRRRRDHRIAAMRDIGEGSAVDKGRRAFERLHEIGRQCVPEQDGHRAAGLDSFCRHRLLVMARADHDARQPLLEIGEIAGETEDRHDLGCDSDVEPALARIAIRRTAEPDHDLPQGPVVHIDDAPEGDAALIDAG